MTEVERQNLKASQEGPNGLVVVRESTTCEVVANCLDEGPHGFARLAGALDMRDESDRSRIGRASAPINIACRQCAPTDASKTAPAGPVAAGLVVIGGVA